MDNKSYTLDRFEGGFAVIIDANGQMQNIERVKMPANAREGDTLLCESGVFTVDYELTQRKRAEITNRFNRLKKKK